MRFRKYITKGSFLFSDRYYFLGVLSFSLLFAGVLFYFSALRSEEVSISPVTMYCLENRDIQACRGISLGLKKLKNRKIKEVIFQRCFCKHIYLYNVDVTSSDFEENKFDGSFFKNVSFFNVDLFKSSFYGAILENVVFENSDLGGVIFNFATFRNVYFKNVDLSSAILMGARFENTYYDQNTKLPFSKEQADRAGLVLKQ